MKYNHIEISMDLYILCNHIEISLKYEQPKSNSWEKEKGNVEISKGRATKQLTLLSEGYVCNLPYYIETFSQESSKVLK